MSTPVYNDNFPEETVPDIDRAIQTGVFDKTYSAAACLASKGNRIFHRGVYGNYADPPPVNKINYEALFDLASLTKPLGAGLAALHLVSKGRLDLSASLAATIPEFKQSKYAHVTIDMLLDHCSGFPALHPLWEELDKADISMPDYKKVCGTSQANAPARKIISSLNLKSEPGRVVEYSDVGFMVLTWIIEDIVKKPLDQYLFREIYQPLGIAEDFFFVRHGDYKQQRQLMKRKFVATEDCAWREKVMQGQVHDSNAWALGGVAGHAGIFGTADATWSLLHRLWLAYKGLDRFFLCGTVRRFWKRSRRIPKTTKTLGWDTPTAHGSMAGKRFSLNTVGHLGFTGTSVWIDLSTDTLAVFLTNSVHPVVAGKKEKMQEIRPRVHDLIAKHSDTVVTDDDNAKGSQAFYGPSPAGTSVPLNNPLRGPGR